MIEWGSLSKELLKFPVMESEVTEFRIESRYAEISLNIESPRDNFVTEGGIEEKLFKQLVPMREREVIEEGREESFRTYPVGWLLIERLVREGGSKLKFETSFIFNFVRVWGNSIVWLNALPKIRVVKFGSEEIGIL